MKGDTGQLTPEEAKRRKLALEKTTRLVTRLGFRTVAGRPGHFYHPDIDQAVVFDWSAATDVESAADVVSSVFFVGLREGQGIARRKVREALGL